MVFAALSMTILPHVVPAVAAMPTPATSAEAQEVSSIVVSAVELSRFGGNQVAPDVAPKVLFNTSLDQFPPLGAALEIPFWSQLLTISALLAVFAAAASDDEDNQEDEKKKNVEMVRVPAIAARLAATAGLFGVHGGVRSVSMHLQDMGLHSSQTFPTSEASMDVPVWAQFLLASVLLGIFAAAISNDDSEKDAKKVVDLVCVPAIAARFAVAAAIWGAPGAARAIATAFGPSANFATSALTTDVPVWAQLGVASVLLAVFAMVVSEDDTEEAEKDCRTINLIRVPATAARLAVAAGCFAVHSALRPAFAELPIVGLSLPSGMLTSANFATFETTTDTPQWAQLLVASVLLAVFALLASDDDGKNKKDQKGVQLVQAPAIAAKLAIAAALFAVPGAVRAAAAAVGPSSNFATSELTTEAPVWAQLAVVSVLLGVFATLISEEEEKESETVAKVLRVPVIACRLAIAAGCFAVHAAVMPSVPELSFSGLKQLSTIGKLPKFLGSEASFLVSEASVDVPIWAQLLVASGLVGIFAAAISEDEAEDGGKEKTVSLVRIPAIATRVAASLALFGVPGALRASSAMFGRSAGFPISELDTEIPAWAQLAVVSTLLGIFAAAISEDEAKDEQDIESGVNLVRVPSIVARLAVVVGCFAIHAALVPSVPAVSFAGVRSVFSAAKAAYARIPFASSPAFASESTFVETPVWAQLLVVSGLLFVFALLTWSETADREESKDKKIASKRVELVRPDAIAARLGAAAAVFAIREALPPLVSIGLSGDVLAKGGLLLAGTAFALSGEIQKSMCTKKVA